MALSTILVLGVHSPAALATASYGYDGQVYSYDVVLNNVTQPTSFVGASAEVLTDTVDVDQISDTPDCSYATNTISPSNIRFSQSSVNNVEEIAASMRANGWVGDPIDVVRMPDGSLVTLDKTRVLAASQAGIDVQATVHGFEAPLSTDMAVRFTTPKGGVPSTWGEALANRIGNQSAAYRLAWPEGSPFTGWGGG